jgi:hypothetical protein
MPQDTTGYPPDFASLLDNYNRELKALMARLEGGTLTPVAWRRSMERLLAKYASAGRLLGSGLSNLNPRDLVAVAKWLKSSQLPYLNQFGEVIAAAAEYNPAWLPRAEMYGAASYSQYWEGKTDGLALPAMPGQGCQCLCVTTGESRIATKRGLVAIQHVKVGDLVLTHLGRWRKVTATYLRVSTPEHRQAWVTSPWGTKVGCTSDHHFMTLDGWKQVDSLDESKDVILNLAYKNLKQVIYNRKQTRPDGGYFHPIVTLAEIMPADTVLYDLEVEEDHSFIIEGLLSHNSNCKCAWEIETLDKEKGNFNGTWVLDGQAQHCQTCLTRAEQWNPVRIRGGDLQP